MDEFPSSLELTAASALLLLSSNAALLLPKTTSISSSKVKDECAVAIARKNCENHDELETISSDSTLCRSSLMTDYSVSTHRSKLMAVPSLKLKNDCAVASKICEDSDEVETISSDSTLCQSSLTTDCSVTTHRSRLMASAVARYHAMKLKVARRARSKVIYRTNSNRKPAPKIWENQPAKTPKTVSTSSLAVTEGTTITESSCLSSGGTSEISSGRTRGKAVVVEQKRRRGTGPSYLSRRAEAILRVLSCKGCASEVRIRQILGDSPDTSKALRMLLRMEEVKRSGAGGRVDPFIYTIAAESESSIVK